ncbi:MAG: T9SS type A sorting domain-containing protein [Bacteroidales bacterium]|nr:T9SS type A sorting domain-containing protein [Bacteroidales bacterium]
MVAVALRAQDNGFLYMREACQGTRAIGVDNDCFIVSSYKTNPETNWQETPSQLQKLSSEGMLLKMVNVGESFTNVTFLHHDNKAGLVYAIGNHWDVAEGGFRPFVACYDNDLNMLSFTDVFGFPVSYTQMMDTRAAVNSDGRVLFVLTTSIWRYLILFTLDGEYLGHLSEANNTNGSGSPFLFHDDSEALGHFGGLGEGLRKIDDALGIETLFKLNVIQNTSLMGSDTLYKLSMFNDPWPTAKSLSDNTFLIASMSLEQLYNLPTIYSMENNALFVKCDTLGHVLNYLLFDPWNDTIDRPAYYQAIDYTDGDAVYLCSFQQLEHDLNGPEFNGNRIVVTKTDSNLNVVWQKRYQLGNSYCVPVYILATSDHGCLIVGYSMVVGGTEPRRLFVLKLSSEGTVSIPEVGTDNCPYSYSFFPNPVDDRLHMEFSPDVTPQAVEIYDVKGRLVGTQNTSLENVDMSQLPSGIYTLNVVVNDGIVYSEKVVKQ